ncbi:MAG: TolC family protein [Acidobacteria bacterium]|nr:TolC family protein [Acidobacteriota bacterium]
MVAGSLVSGTILLFGGSHAAAQEPSPRAVMGELAQQATRVAVSPPLKVDAAVRIALDLNPVTRAAAEGVRVAEEAVGEARAPYYPTLSVAASYGRWETHAFLPEGLVGSTIPSTIGPTDDWTAAFTGRYTLYDSGRRAADLRAALAQQRVAEHEAARVRQDLALEVRRTFYALVAARDGERVADTNLARAEEHLRLALERRAAGAVSGGDVVQAQVHVAEARLARVRVESLVQQARGALNTAMGLPVATPVEADSQEAPVAPPHPVEVSGGLAQALTDRPTIAAAVQRALAATEAVSAAQSAFGPKIAAEWSVGLRDSHFFPSERDWRAGVTVTWSLFDGFAKRHRLAGARAAHARDEAEVERTKQTVQAEVWSAHATLRETHEAIAAADVLIRDADENVRIARERYRVGAGTVNELLDAQAALARAGAVRAQAAWDYRTARATYDWTIGRALPAGAPPGSVDGGL